MSHASSNSPPVNKTGTQMTYLVLGFTKSTPLHSYLLLCSPLFYSLSPLSSVPRSHSLALTSPQQTPVVQKYILMVKVLIYKIQKHAPHTVQTETSNLLDIPSKLVIFRVGGRVGM